MLHQSLQLLQILEALCFAAIMLPTRHKDVLIIPPIQFCLKLTLSF